MNDPGSWKIVARSIENAQDELRVAAMALAQVDEETLRELDQLITALTGLQNKVDDVIRGESRTQAI